MRFCPSFVHSRRIDVRKHFELADHPNESSDSFPLPNMSARANHAVTDHFGALLDSSVDEFLIRCSELDVLMRSRVPDGIAILEVRRKLLDLESRLYITGSFPSSSKLDLYGKAALLVKARLRRGKLHSRSRVGAAPLKQSERMCSIERTYETFSPKSRADPTPIVESPHDRGFYRIVRLLDEISATKSLPENQLNLSDLDLTDAHLAALCKRSRCNLQRICKLELSGNMISDASKIVALLAGSRHLSFVSLRGNRLTTEGVIELAQAVLNKPSVVGIDATRNGLDTKQLQHYLVMEHDRIQRNRPEKEVVLFRHALGKILIDKDTTCLHLLNVLANTCGLYFLSLRVAGVTCVVCPCLWT